MKTNDFYFDLPEDLIAQVPLKNRDESRLMTLDKNTGEVKHKTFRDILECLNDNDILVLNNTRVIPARLFGFKAETNAEIEILLLSRKDINTWEALTKPAKRLKLGTRIIFGDGLLIGVVKELQEEGIRTIEFEYEGIFEDVLDRLGNMPLPPYIHEKLEDKERYQTVYSKVTGSSAAPTAGLHFTPEILLELKNKGVQIEYVTLHVGLGTFRPVKAESIFDHTMHKEYFEIAEDVKNRLNEAKKNGKRIVCVGTTSVRTLESSANIINNLDRDSGWTDIFIYPSYEFKFVDAMITNFHLPESTLIMMISAFAGKNYIMDAYEEAIKEKYRFFSFGDAMYIF
ncbi:S-adenosylmethionine:tRNA ribosyltransferase-isomerase [Acetoanaerobium noterae]|uniref:S-adenosylmethionine:tRNA ribosyltransferase-isomerase n=1 Tax=Acetoanaerobium noterae TaxID=745369 RepID=A0A1T5CL29_9FIRM|nr:tRNA preQ1(34) S-adenosylmethionine ribosyltransferase-isomerase QueA [Acetoanaerobium noterae]MBP8762848.1 tRNA preQ1(34) S-adenosylmethionine ribosyltransferase-isomerase QueA [Acetoanaerobium sp.]MBP9499317.1 tRNA preQ1(34) S-adenosylmethionine ribosyltransferase-isomerase QueA [Acetoanaerobium sp.]MBP9561993.1 tRNA preQ1(34) S-adenosylmethionine ribosyltransferase-isomerase QueA [Acetoanaerobium sp.]SKB60053.1 S-adenosylmethionine:tRNA ribosyltransferase-isomerase [Acetoanaerobium notera